MKNIFAFTLAETLIVMGIIGIVAALTLPNLNSSTGEKEKIAKLQKIYSDLQDAFGRAEAVYGPFSEWFINDGSDDDKIAKRAYDRITEFMKYSKSCTISDNCTLIFDSAADSQGAGSTSRYGLILADGSTIGFNTGDQFNPIHILVDLDGFNKGANAACKDYFRFNISEKRGLSINHSPIIYNTKLYTDDAPDCTTWIIQYGNMDYLKAGNGKCPNGEQLKFNEKTSCN